MARLSSKAPAEEEILRALDAVIRVLQDNRSFVIDDPSEGVNPEERKAAKLLFEVARRLAISSDLILSEDWDRIDDLIRAALQRHSVESEWMRGQLKFFATPDPGVGMNEDSELALKARRDMLKFLSAWRQGQKLLLRRKK